MKVCISLGGSVIVPGKVNIKFLREFRKVILSNEQHKYKIVVGGGKVAREYMSALDSFGVSKEEQHMLGVKITKVNAYLVAKILGFKYAAEVPPQKVARIKGNTVSAGWKPGFTTDVDTALVAKYWKADFVINVTNVKGVYDKDPRRYKNAKFLPKLSYEQLIRICLLYTSPSPRD